MATITIIGAGYVGLSTAALLSNAGHTVHLIEINPKRLKTIKSGKSFFYEAGINNLIVKALKQKTLLPTDSYQNAVPDSTVIFSCVGTPDNPDGSSNMTYVFSAAEETAKHAKPGTIYAQKSTVPVETGQKVQQVFKSAGVPIKYVSNPEFLREGTAIADTLWFDRIVCGSNDRDAIETVFDIYRTLEKNRSKLARTAKIEKPSGVKEGSYIPTGLESAELIKVSANAFLALKISFANSIAKLADSVGADVVEVMDAVGEDQRIGRAFLNAGRGYGGGCFPKDMSGLIDVMNEHGADSSILTAAQDVNQSMNGYIVKRLQDKLGELEGTNVAVLGLAFKAGTSDTRKSPGITIANMLAKRGAKVTAYDPQANEEASEDLRKEVGLCSSRKAALEEVQAVVVATDWPEFKELAAKDLPGKVIVDAMNIYKLEDPRIIGVGRSSERSK